MEELKKLSDEQLVQEYVVISSWIDFVMNEPLGDWQEQIAEAGEEYEPIMKELKARGLTKTAEDTYSEYCNIVERVKCSSDDELINIYIDVYLAKFSESSKYEDCDWSKIKKYNNELGIIDDELVIRNITLDAEVALKIHQGRITKDRVDELKNMSTEKLESELKDGEQIMEEYYGNTFYLQKYENDESFIKAGNGISAENSIISLILKDRDNKTNHKSGEVTQIPLVADKAKEVASVSITKND